MRSRGDRTVRRPLRSTALGLRSAMNLLLPGLIALLLAAVLWPEVALASVRQPATKGLQPATNRHRKGQRTSNELATKGRPSAVTDQDDHGRLLKVRDNDD